MAKTNKVSGTSIDTPEMEQMRRTVVEQELSARSWKAYYEKMHYALEAEKLEPEFAEFQKRAAEKQRKAQEAYEEFIKGIEKQTEVAEEGVTPTDAEGEE